MTITIMMAIIPYIRDVCEATPMAGVAVGADVAAGDPA
jgi:hypothetical protein